MSDASPTTDQITRALERLFVRHRIVVWSDAETQFGDDSAAVALDDVTVLTVANNEFGLKHRILREEPVTRFLLYRPGEPPEERHNWLLDVELAYCTFVADRETLLAQDVGLPEGAGHLASEHGKFFTTAKRRTALAKRLSDGDSPGTVRLKMLAVITRTDDNALDSVLRALLQEAADRDDGAADLISQCWLDRYLWNATAAQYGYAPETPTIEDFSLWLFEQSLTGVKPSGAPDAEGRKAAAAAVFFRGWQDSVKYSPGFRALSTAAAQALDVKNKIAAQDVRTLLQSDAFRAFDEKIVTALSTGVTERGMSSREVADWVRERRRTFWVNDPSDDQHILDHLYQAIGAAANFLAAVESFSPSIDSFDDGLSKYAGSWFHIDQHYRQFTFHTRAADNHPVLEGLRDKVEKFYSNKFLRPLGDAWQHRVDTAHPWRAATVRSQQRFFDTRVAPVLKGGRNKVVVVISDGLRYEVADELRTRIRQQDRFDAELDHMLGVLPSYTQLGMAALLPHASLQPDDKGFVHVDGQPSAGTENRAKLLEPVGGTAIQAENFLSMTKDEARDLLKSVQVLYVYHDRIDKRGDAKATEAQVFTAAEETFTELLGLLRKLANANANNVLITADHGFIYQDTPIDDSEFISEPPHGDALVHRSSRFVFGRDLKVTNAFTKFSARDLDLAGDLEVLIPKSIGRLRRPGSGTRYVHGGAALQEIVIPVLAVNKKRSSDVRIVDVELVVRSTTITTGQILVEMYQATAVGDKVQPRTLRIGLYAGDELISDQVSHTFDLQADDPRDRTVTVKLLLTTAADAHDGKQVELRLEAPVPKTTHFTTYTRATYTLRRSFTADFDF